MGSEMQLRVARALFEARAGRQISDEQWARHVASYFELAAAWPEYAKGGGDGVSDAFRFALAAMEAMREPNTRMLAAQTAWRDDPERRTSTLYRAMLDAEIEAAKKGL